MQRTPSLMLVLALVAVASTTRAQMIGGGGPASTDCWVTLSSMPSPNRPTSKPSYVQCADQDVTCGDQNPALGYCQFQAQLSLNTSTGFPLCAPTDAMGFNIPYSGPTNDDHPKHINDFEVLQQFGEGNMPLSSTDLDKLSGFKSIGVRLGVSLSGKPHFINTTLKLQPTVCTSGLLTDGKCPPGFAKDSDTFKFVCTAPVDMTGAKISPCSGIASTFQQIQEHIFDRKCSNMATCHGSADPAHDLCLKPICGARSAYTDLVGVTPHNFFASTDGLKRVDPTNLSNSLLWRKLKGGSLLNNTTFGTSAYGFRMPYHNPSADRARPKLTGGEIKLIEQWILAGAPQTGFIATTFSGACQ